MASPANDASGGIAGAAVPVTAAVAIRQDVPNVISTIGTVQIDSIAIQSQVSGPIVKIEFSPGQDVKKGQELFLIDPRPYVAAIDQAQAQLAHDQAVLAEAQTDLVRYQTLPRENSIARQQADDQAYVVQQDKGTVQLRHRPRAVRQCRSRRWNQRCLSTFRVRPLFPAWRLR